MARIAKTGLEGWDLPEPSKVGATIAETRASRGAGPAAAGALGVSLGAAGDLVRRLKVLQAEKRPDDPEPDEPPDRPHLTVVGTGVKSRG